MSRSWHDSSDEYRRAHPVPGQAQRAGPCHVRTWHGARPHQLRPAGSVHQQYRTPRAEPWACRPTPSSRCTSTIRFFHSAIVLALANIGVATCLGARAGISGQGCAYDAILTDDAHDRAAGIDQGCFTSAWTGRRATACRTNRTSLYRGAGDALCRISLTSGSTGEAKADRVHPSHAGRAACPLHPCLWRQFPGLRADLLRPRSAVERRLSPHCSTFFRAAARCSFPAQPRWTRCRRSSSTGCRG